MSVEHVIKLKKKPAGVLPHKKLVHVFEGFNLLPMITVKGPEAQR